MTIRPRRSVLYMPGSNARALEKAKTLPVDGIILDLEDAVAQARKMIAAFDLPENKDKGVVQIDGRMVERMHAEMARRTVAIAEAIEAQS